MKKIILSAAFVAFAGLSFANANEINKSVVEITIQADTTKTPVKLEDLPEAVKTTLASEPVKVWVAQDAAFVKTEKEEYYLINVKKEQEVGALKIDKDGKIIQ